MKKIMYSIANVLAVSAFVLVVTEKLWIGSPEVPQELRK